MVNARAKRVELVLDVIVFSPYRFLVDTAPRRPCVKSLRSSSVANERAGRATGSVDSGSEAIG
jgi:hypothetical protein